MEKGRQNLRNRRVERATANHQTGSFFGKRPRLVSAPRTLFDKDVLRVGTWVAGEKTWRVTPEILRRLVVNFQRARSHGIRVPVVWNHSHDARDKLGEIIRLYVSGPTLRVRFWTASSADARHLARTEGEASLEVAEPWIDGEGRRYDIFVTHLAMVNHPVVSGQGPPLRLSLDANGQLTFYTGDPFMVETTAPPATAEEIDIANATRLVNEIVTSLGTSHRLGDALDFPSFINSLKDLRDRVEAMVAADAEMETAQLSLEERFDEVSRELADARREISRERETRFHEGVDRLIREGRLHAADKASLLEAARPANYSLSLLAPFERLSVGAAVPVAGRARRMAQPHPPADRTRSSPSDDRLRAIVQNYAP